MIWGLLLGPDHLYTHPLSLLTFTHQLFHAAADWADLGYVSALCKTLCQEPFTQRCSVTSQETGILNHTAMIITKETVVELAVYLEMGPHMCM